MSQPTVDALALLRKSNALLEGHFVLSSGLHSAQYVQCAQLFQYPDLAEQVGRALAVQAPAADLVVSPAMGGLFLGHEVARALGKRHIFTERDEGRMVLRRGFTIQPGDKIIVVEDVFTTGKSTREVIEVIKGHGGVLVAAVSLVDRSSADLGFGVPTTSLVRIGIEAWDPAQCPLCKSGSTAIKPGSRPAPGRS